MKSNPKISVVMSVYNEPINWLRDSIDSILNQTFSDFEFIIIGDSPENDRVNNLIKKYQESDGRLRFYPNQKNMGLTKSLNKGLVIAKGNYIARMDADDISEPNRLETQFNYLVNHQEVSIVHSYIQVVDENGTAGEMKEAPLSNKGIVQTLTYSNCIFHPAVMFRRQLFKEKGLRYNESFKRSQDYELWLNAALKGLKFATIPTVLLHYRVSQGQITQRHREAQLKDQDDIRRAFFRKVCGLENIQYPDAITRRYVRDFNYKKRDNDNYITMCKALRFQLYYTLPLSWSKFIAIIPDSLYMGFNIKQVITLFLSFVKKDRWKGYNMSYLVTE